MFQVEQTDVDAYSPKDPSIFPAGATIQSATLAKPKVYTPLAAISEILGELTFIEAMRLAGLLHDALGEEGLIDTAITSEFDIANSLMAIREALTENE